MMMMMMMMVMMMMIIITNQSFNADCKGRKVGRKKEMEMVEMVESSGGGRRCGRGCPIRMCMRGFSMRHQRGKKLVTKLGSNEVKRGLMIFTEECFCGLPFLPFSFPFFPFFPSSPSLLTFPPFLLPPHSALLVVPTTY